jgi:hypothetical protein
VVESIGVPREEYAYADKSTSAATAPCRHWSIVSGGVNGVSQALRPAGQPGRDESFYSSFVRTPTSQHQCRRPGPIDEGRAVGGSRSCTTPGHPRNEGVRSKQHYVGTSVLIHEVGTTQAQPPTLPLHLHEANTPENRPSWPRRSRRTEGHVDRAVLNIAFTRHCTGTSGSSFKALPRSGAMRVSYEEHDEVAPTLRSEVTSLARERRVRQRQRRSSTSQTVRSSTPRQPSGHKEDTVTDGLGAIKAFDYMVRPRVALRSVRTSCPMGSTRSCTWQADPTFRKRIWQSETHNFRAST